MSDTEHVERTPDLGSGHPRRDPVGASGSPRYDSIGDRYSLTRREDPLLAERILHALSDSATVVNVGAGTGSYEPDDRHVIAIEPSDVMAAQRPAGRVPALRGSAVPLPLRDRSVDAAMAILTVHHWDDQTEDGVRELRRVARGPVIIVTVDVEVCARMWLLRDYLPEVVELDRATFPTIDRLVGWLGGTVEVEPVPTTSDTPDWSLASFWAHPERVLDEAARRATSAFSRLRPDVVARAVASVGRDLRDGTWDARNGHLRALQEHDVGVRLLIARP
ncbi:MAG: class I SAM-dependent methyltransferase [Acidimicrobiales bacterium]|jgi:SAM-dependent methyltransferase|nr:class I SAM-dependent methyltransferase [Acidimicrobiales bacterium]